MESKKCIFFFLCVSLMIIFLISFATKGAHWDKVANKSYAEEAFPEVYRSLEGLIVVDVLLFFLFIPIIIFFHTNNVSLIRIMIILLGLLIFIRFILGIIFLAGDGNYCRSTINYWDDLPQYLKDMYSSINNYYTTLKGAWAFEIICNLLVYLMCGGVFFFLCQRTKQN